MAAFVAVVEVVDHGYCTAMQLLDEGVEDISCLKLECSVSTLHVKKNTIRMKLGFCHR